LSNRFTSKNPSTPQGKRGRLRKKKERRRRITSQLKCKNSSEKEIHSTADDHLALYAIQLKVLANISEEPTASTSPKGSSETLANTSTTTRRINPDQHLNLHHRENFRSRI
jgi:hypothetical protein